MTYDAKGLIAKAELQSERLGRPVDPITFAQREDDDIEALQAAVEAEISAAELSPEQVWLGELKVRFDALQQLHEGIQWTDVKRSLLAAPESMGKLRALDEKGHRMNVFGEEGDEFIFVSGWNNHEQVASDHKNITYDLKGQKLAESQGRHPNDNAISIIAKIMDVEEDEANNYLADPKFHEQLRRVMAVHGFAWFKTDAVTRMTGDAFCGGGNAIYYQNFAHDHNDHGSFRAELRVKKA